MAGPGVVPQFALVSGLTGALDLDTDTLKVMLLKASYTPNPDHKFVSSIAGSECDATGYTGGFNGTSRKTLGSVTVSEDATANEAVVDAADPSAWEGLGGDTDNEVGYIATIKEITNDAASLVVSINEFAPLNTNGGNVEIAWHTDGIFRTAHTPEE